MKPVSRRAERRYGCGLASRLDIMLSDEVTLFDAVTLFGPVTLFDELPLFDEVTAALGPETVKEVPATIRRRAEASAPRKA